MTMRQMQIGDIYTGELLADELMKRFAANAVRMMGMTFEEFSRCTFASGGVLAPPAPRPLREGVVGYTVTGNPIYDGAWFDKQMGGGHSVTVRVEGGVIPIASESCPDCARKIMKRPEPATGFLAKCGRRLVDINECSANSPCPEHLR